MAFVDALLMQKSSNINDNNRLGSLPNSLRDKIK